MPKSNQCNPARTSTVVVEGNAVVAHDGAVESEHGRTRRYCAMDGVRVLGAKEVGLHGGLCVSMIYRQKLKFDFGDRIFPR